MINKDFLTGKIKTVFGNKITDIEGWQEALNSDEMYVPHHKLEKDYTKKELIEMDRYDIVPPEELIWLPQSFHNGNPNLHKGCADKIKSQTGKQIGKRNLETRKNKDGFTDKFIKHFGINAKDDMKLYRREKQYYYRYNHKCSWEI